MSLNFDSWIYRHKRLGSLFSVGYLCAYHGGEITLDRKEHTGYIWITKKDLDSLPISDRFKETVRRFVL